MNPHMIYLLLMAAFAAITIIAFRISKVPLYFGVLAALTEGRNSPRVIGEGREWPAASGEKGYAGGIACLNATGYVIKGSTSTTLNCVGRFADDWDNTDGGDGDITVKIDTGAFGWDNSANSDEITSAEIGSSCYIVDDQTVAKTSGSSTRSIAGIIVDVDDNYVYVLASPVKAASTGVVAANNLSDVSSAATARANIGANVYALELSLADLVAADTAVYRVIAPFAGTITKVYWVLEGHALATGDATLTGKIGATGITTGVITVTQSGSAIGDHGVVSPSAANVVAAGDVVSFTVGGANTNAAATARLTILVRT